MLYFHFFICIMWHNTWRFLKTKETINVKVVKAWYKIQLLVVSIIYKIIITTMWETGLYHLLFHILSFGACLPQLRGIFESKYTVVKVLISSLSFYKLPSFLFLRSISHQWMVWGKRNFSATPHTLRPVSGVSIL